jgi:hypothetical protein
MILTKFNLKSATTVRVRWLFNGPKNPKLQYNKKSRPSLVRRYDYPQVSPTYLKYIPTENAIKRELLAW